MFQAQWLHLISSMLVWHHPQNVVHLGRELEETNEALWKDEGRVGKQKENSQKHLSFHRVKNTATQM